MILYALLTAFFAIALMNRIMAGLVAGLGVFGVWVPGADYPQLFFVTLLLAVVWFFAMAGIVKLVFLIFAVNIPFMKVMDLLGAALIPYVLCTAVSIMFVFIHIELGVAAVLLGTITFLGFLYRGMQDAAGERTSVMWGFFGVVCTYIALDHVFQLIAERVLS